MKVGKAVIDAVGRIAPAVAGAMGGPGAARVTQQVSQVLTGRPDAPEDDIRAQVENLTEPQAAALSALDEQITARERIAAEDRADARARQESTGDLFPAVLAILALISLLAAGGTFLFFEPSGSARDILLPIVGALVVMAKQGFDFFLGSSTGSKRKDGALSRLANRRS